MPREEVEVSCVDADEVIMPEIEIQKKTLKLLKERYAAEKAAFLASTGKRMALPFTGFVDKILLIGVDNKDMAAENVKRLVDERNMILLKQIMEMADNLRGMGVKNEM